MDQQNSVENAENFYSLSTDDYEERQQLLKEMAKEIAQANDNPSTISG